MMIKSKNDKSLNGLLSELKGKKIVIWGLGLNFGGLEATKFFAKIKKAQILILDTKRQEELEESLKKLQKYKNISFLLGREQREEDFEGASLIIKNPAIPWENPLVKILQKKGFRIETDISLFFRFFQGQIIGITGSKGKTTTTVLIGELLKSDERDVLLGGNIRISLFSFLQNKILKDSKKIAVLELSSFQLEDLAKVKRSPNVAVVTNILRDHLNRYGNYEKYIQAKKNISCFQTRKDFLVLNQDDKHWNSFAQGKGQKIYFSLKKIKQNEGFLLEKSQIYKVESAKRKPFLNLIGLNEEIFLKINNQKNLLASLAVADKVFKINREKIKKTLKKFPGVPLRLEKVAIKKGIVFYNDTTATMPDATIGALESFKNQKIVLISGGADKNLKFEKMAKTIAKKVKEAILLPGSATPKIKLALDKYAPNLKYKEVTTLDRAVKLAYKKARPRGIVLLSPGCASFGLFKNEFDRGEQFNGIVKMLCAELK